MKTKQNIRKLLDSNIGGLFPLVYKEKLIDYLKKNFSYKEPQRKATEWEKIFATYITEKRLTSSIKNSYKSVNTRDILIEKWAKQLNRHIKEKKFKWLINMKRLLMPL